MSGALCSLSGVALSAVLCPRITVLAGARVGVRVLTVFCARLLLLMRLVFGIYCDRPFLSATKRTVHALLDFQLKIACFFLASLTLFVTWVYLSSLFGDENLDPL